MLKTRSDPETVTDTLFKKIVCLFCIHFGLPGPPLDAPAALKTRPKRLKSAPRRSQKRFLAVSGGLLGRSWVLLGRFGALRALVGVPSRPLGSILRGFCIDFGVHTAKDEGIHHEPSSKK